MAPLTMAMSAVLSQGETSAVLSQPSLAISHSRHPRRSAFSLRILPTLNTPWDRGRVLPPHPTPQQRGHPPSPPPRLATRRGSLSPHHHHQHLPAGRRAASGRQRPRLPSRCRSRCGSRCGRAPHTRRPPPGPGPVPVPVPLPRLSAGRRREPPGSERRPQPRPRSLPAPPRGTGTGRAAAPPAARGEMGWIQGVSGKIWGLWGRRAAGGERGESRCWPGG